MVMLVRILVLLALALVAVTPTHAYWAPAAEHHARAGHTHAGQPSEEPAQEHDESKLCCASVAMQCGSAALAADGRWSPAEPLSIDVARVREPQTSSEAPLPDFEPPPPRI